MTFKHKLAKRLAISWRYLVPALVLLGCETASQLGTEPATDSPLAQLVVSPNPTSTDYQDTVRFRAYGRTAAGDSVPTPVQWSATGGSVSADGLFTSDTLPGDYSVTARTEGGVESSARVVVGVSGSVAESRTSTPRPSAVTDLKVTAVGDTAATLSFTEVEDGTGRPAQYDIRVAPSPMNWGSATSVSRGTCSVPVAGTSVGATRACTVLGLAPTTGYDFRLVAFRGTLNVDAIFGMLSNLATATTTATPVITQPGTVADLTVASVSDTSATLSFTEVTNGAGQPASYDIRYAAAPISWGSATTVAQGTCTVPTVGAVIGAKLTCTVLGLAAATAYQFQLVAFRGTLNQDAAFGSVSNIASGTTAARSVVASVTVSPSTASGTVGQSAQFTATVADAAGNVLTDRAVTWSSSDIAVVTVDANGFATATGPGSAAIIAASEGKSGQASVSVSGSATQSVASVTVTPSTASGSVGQSAQFTATVKDAAGNELTGRTITWSSSDPAVVTVDASGFATATGPGSATLTATCEGKSGQASVSVSGSSTQQVASVTVSPSSASIGVGGTQQFTAVLKDAQGNTLTGRTITWSSSNALVATASGNGLVTGLLAGTATITGTSEGQSGTASVTVAALPPPPSGGWPNEPSGFTAVTDQPWGAAIPVGHDLPISLGWKVYWNDRGLITAGTDASGPASPAGTVEFLYPAGYPGGAGPGAPVFGFPGSRKVYVGLWWRTNATWQGHLTGYNKIEYLFAGNSGSAFLAMLGSPGGPYEIAVHPQFSTSPSVTLKPNVNTVRIVPGQWYRIEWLIDYDGGIIRWWVDGQPVGDYSGQPLPSDLLNEFKLDPVWGGAGDVKAQADTVHFDHTRISVR